MRRAPESCMIPVGKGLHELPMSLHIKAHKKLAVNVEHGPRLVEESGWKETRPTDKRIYDKIIFKTGMLA